VVLGRYWWNTYESVICSLEEKKCFRRWKLGKIISPSQILHSRCTIYTLQIKKLILLALLWSSSTKRENVLHTEAEGHCHTGPNWRPVPWPFAACFPALSVHFTVTSNLLNKGHESSKTLAHCYYLEAVDMIQNAFTPILYRVMWSRRQNVHITMQIHTMRFAQGGKKKAFNQSQKHCIKQTGTPHDTSTQNSIGEQKSIMVTEHLSFMGT